MDNHYRIVGTAGHIDHGKSALVRALTGTDPDRLQEERDRGITIDLGFAHLELADDVLVGFIDVPGHEKFVKNMLAGIGGIDAVLLVVAADESIMPQTREHLSICELLGVGAGVVAITKADLVDHELAELVELEVRELLAGSRLADVPIVRTSATTGEGLDDLRAALATALQSSATRPETELVRLPIDRVFTVHGFGTVVTGTLLSGRISSGDKLELLPRRTGVTVRGLQVYGESVGVAVAGQRTAVNLQGVDPDAAVRGDLLVTPAALEPTYMIDARVRMLPEHELEQLQRVRFHHGATETLGRAAILEGDAIRPGASGLVQLRLETPYGCAPGDRFVLRRYSPMLTIGGGTVIDSLPAKHRHADAEALRLLGDLESATLEDSLAALAGAAGSAGAGVDRLGRRLFVSAERLESAAEALADAGRLLVAQSRPLFVLDPGAAQAMQSAILDAVRAHHATNPLEPGLPKSTAAAALPRDLPEIGLDALIDGLVATGRLERSATALALPEHDVTLDEGQERTRAALLDLFARGGWSPPGLEEAFAAAGTTSAAGEPVFRHMLRAGELVRLRDDLVFSAERLAALSDELRARYAPGEAFGVADFKGWTEVSRKHAIPLLEYLDQRRVTRREGDKRVRV